MKTTINDNLNQTIKAQPIERNTIHHEVTFPVSPDQVYQLLTDGEKFGAVTGQPGPGGGITGASFSLFNGWLQGRQVELVPNKLISQAWRFMNWEPGHILPQNLGC